MGAIKVVPVGRGQRKTGIRPDRSLKTGNRNAKVSRSGRIRVGILRCDTHGPYYAALMGAHDPWKLQRPMEGVEGDPCYSWMTGGVHFYLYADYCRADRMTAKAVEGFEVVKVWDENRLAAETLSGILDSHPKVCGSFDEVSDDVDLVFIADCNGDGSDHWKLAAPGLRKGVATFIDKPLAWDRRGVARILSLARENGAPVFSASILRHLPGALQFRSRLPEVGLVESGFVRGGGRTMAGQIHTVSLVQAAFGGGIREVRAMGPEEMGVLHVSWGQSEGRPAAGVVIHQAVRETWHASSHVSAYGPEGAIFSNNTINDWYFPSAAARILELVKEMVVTRTADASMDDMIEAVAVVCAARQSRENGGRPARVRTEGLWNRR